MSEYNCYGCPYRQGVGGFYTSYWEACVLQDYKEIYRPNVECFRRKNPIKSFFKVIIDFFLSKPRVYSRNLSTHDEWGV